MNFNEMQLGMKSLSSAMLIDNFIIGFQEYTYEDYLRDYLNASPWFRERHPLGFVKPASESKGECDAISDTYGIDFKSLESSTLLQAKSILDHQITVIGFYWKLKTYNLLGDISHAESLMQVAENALPEEIVDRLKERLEKSDDEDTDATYNSEYNQNH